MEAAAGTNFAGADLLEGQSSADETLVGTKLSRCGELVWAHIHTSGLVMVAVVDTPGLLVAVAEIVDLEDSVARAGTQKAAGVNIHLELLVPG